MTADLRKPAKGSGLIARKEKRRLLTKAEDVEKDKCRRRDRRCRWPHCPYCRKYKDLIPQAAHVIQAKGMSGDRPLARSQSHRLLLLCPPMHGLQEQHLADVRPLTDVGTDGPCEFWRRETQEQPWFLVAREVAPFIYERD